MWGNTLYITAKCQPRQWDPSKLDFRIGRIDFLADVKDTLVERITISVALDALDEDIVLSLSDIVEGVSRQYRPLFPHPRPLGTDEPDDAIQVGESVS